MLPYLSLTEIRFGAVTLQVWGVFVALGFTLALARSLREARKISMKEDEIWDVMIIAFLGMIAGGRIFYVISDPAKNITALIDAHSGFSLVGGMIMGGVMSLLYLKIKKQDFKEMADLLTPGFIIALIFVRIGCFLVNDHIGKITTMPWGVSFADGTVRHSVVLYEILFLILLAGLMRKLKSKHKVSGSIFLVFFLAYAIFRFSVDFLRCDDFSFCDMRFWGLTLNQWIWLGLFALVLIFYSLEKRGVKRLKEQENNCPIDI